MGKHQKQRLFCCYRCYRYGQREVGQRERMSIRNCRGHKDLINQCQRKVDAMKECLIPILQNIGESIEARWNAVKESTASIFDSVSQSLSSVGDNIKNSVTSNASALSGNFLRLSCLTSRLPTLSHCLPHIFPTSLLSGTKKL